MNRRSHNGSNGRISLRHQIRIKTIGKFFGNKVGRQLSRHKSWMYHQGIQETNIVINTANIIGIQSINHAVNRLTSIIAIGNQFGDHRIIMHRHFAALKDTTVHSDPFTSRL